MKKKIISLLMIISISVLCGCGKKDEHIEVSEDMQASVQESESENVIQEEITDVADDNANDESDNTQDVEEDKRDFDESDFDEDFDRYDVEQDANEVWINSSINIKGELSEEECYEFTRLFQTEIDHRFLLSTYEAPQYADLYLVYEGASEEDVDVESDRIEMEERALDY